jgi:hypothetical protein
MKRIVGAVLACLSLAAIAGEAEAQLVGVEFGVRGGVSVASASFDLETVDADNRTGFVGGPFLNLDFGIFGAQVAGVYHQMGFESEDLDLDLDYLEVPVVLKVGLPLPLLKPSVFGGVSLGFEGACEVNGVECSEDDTSGTQYAGVAGADVRLSLGVASLWVDGRYNFGLSDVNDAGDALAEIGDFQNRAWNFTVGIGFGL